MAELEMVDVGTGCVHRIAVDGEVAEPAEAPALVPMNWLPLASGRFVDVPVAASDGQTYIVLPFVHPLERLVKCLLTAKSFPGRFAVTVEDIDKAIERLTKAREKLTQSG